MRAILFHLGPIVIYSYGFFLALAYLLASYVFWKEGKKQGYQEEKLLDFSVAALIASIIGGRFFYTLLNFSYFSLPGNFAKIFYFWEGGFAYYGSFFLVLLVGTYLARRWRWSFLQIADIGAIAATLAIVLGKIGSFFAGNDYGTLTKLPWGVIFPNLEGARHPTQLYDSLLFFLLFLGLYIYYKANTLRAYRLKSGAVFFYFLLWSNLIRLFTEQFRGDSTYLGPIKLGSFFALVLALFAIFSLYYFQFRNFKNDSKTISHYFLGIGSRIRSPLHRKPNY